MKRFILIFLLLVGNRLVYSAEDTTAVGYSITSWKDTLFIGEPLILTNILINNTRDTIRLYDPGRMYSDENPKITITYPDGKRNGLMLQFMGERDSENKLKYVNILPKDTLIINLVYPQSRFAVNLPFLVKPGGYKIKASFHMLCPSSQVPIGISSDLSALDDEKLWRHFIPCTSNSVTLTVLGLPRGEKRASEDFISDKYSAEEFLQKYPGSIYTPYVLYKYSAELGSKSKNEEACKILERLVNNYPDYTFTKYCVGSVISYYAHMKNKAMVDKYKSILSKYPKFYFTKNMPKGKEWK